MDEWRKKNPSLIINFYTDEDCEDYLQKHFSENHKKTFKNIKHGKVKGDYFTAHKLLEGGIFLDCEYEPFDLLPIRRQNTPLIPKYGKQYSTNLIIINNEKVFKENNNFYCDNLDLKIIPEELNKYYKVQYIVRSSNKKGKQKIIHQD